MNDDEQTLPRRPLRAWREGQYLTLKELAELVGVKFQTVWNWETGRARPEFRNMRALAKALGIQPQQIILPDQAMSPKESPVAA